VAEDNELSTKLTVWQRLALRRLRRLALKGKDAPLTPDDWRLVYAMSHSGAGGAMRHVWRTLPSSPRCNLCGAPFAGVGQVVARPLGHRPSRKNPNICSTCVEMSPPGGMTMHTGVLFADMRGFTARSETTTAAEMAKLLRRFYGCAERVLFPEAMIDKVVGDQVMALYIADVHPTLARDRVPELMVDHARRLLREIGYGTVEGPFVEVGIGLDIGDAFVGNIGERSVYDFTAIGDVVNTAARLQGTALSGEIVISQRIANDLDAPPKDLELLPLKGKAVPEPAYRLRVG
jgi:adenylate cyclase